MTIDVQQFVQTFLEESFEGLDTMEAQLLELNGEDTASIDTIFRAAHSIKGGAGTFGFSAVSDFTHGVETLLDQMRSGTRSTTPELTALLLEAVDCIRSMLSATDSGQTPDARKVADTAARIESWLVDNPAHSRHPEPPATTTPPPSQGWRIRFEPHPDIMMTGNDPLRILGALSELGDMACQCDLGRLPPIETLDPEQCHLSWDIIIHGDIPRAAIDSVFEWVEDECNLTIDAITADDEAPAPAADQPPRSSQPPGDPPREQHSTTQGRQRDQSSSIRVNTQKIDALIDMVGELVITQSMLGELSERLQNGDPGCMEQLLDGITQLERNTRELQENVMGIRMLPISFAFNRIPRMVHDLGGRLGKSLQLRLAGEQTELDKTVLEKISDPLVHLVRNAADHGIETPEQRAAAGKPETGTIQLNAFHKGGNIIIEIADDGAGLNRERIRERALHRGLITEDQALSDDQLDDLIFAPGFSTAEAISDVSGRGVGMDVVRQNINSLGGAVEISSEPGAGSRVTIRLPLTLSILDGQLIEVGQEKYVIPLVSIIESIQVTPGHLRSVADSRLLYRLRDQYIPVLFPDQLLLGDARRDRDLDHALLVVVEAEGQQAGLVVDDLLGQQQVVIKALETNFRRVDGIAGATILGDGTVALILDASGLMHLASRRTPDAPLLKRRDNAAA
ncbi:MAG: chemotaxis protein CheA [Pseudomonadota bacterium]